MEESSCNAFDPWYSMDVETKHKRETKMNDEYEGEEEEREEDPCDESERLEAESNYRRDNADHEVVSKDELLDRLRSEMEELMNYELEDLAVRYLGLNRSWGCTAFVEGGKVFFRLLT